MKTDYIKDTRISRKYPGRKQKASGYVHITGLPYRDAEGLSQLRSCLHDEIINSVPIKGEKSTNPNCIDNVYLEM